MKGFIKFAFLASFFIMVKPLVSQNIVDLQKTATDLVSAGNLSDAEAVYKQIVSLDSTDFDANVWLGNYYYLKGKESLDNEDLKYNAIKEPSRMQMALHMDFLKSIYADHFSKSEPYLDRAYKKSRNEYLKKTIDFIYDYKVSIGVIKLVDKNGKRIKPGK